MLGACLLHAEEADGDLLPRSCRHGSRLGGGHVIGEGDVIVAGFSRVLSAQCPLTFDKGVVKGKVHMCSQCDLPCHWAGARACGTPPPIFASQWWYSFFVMSQSSHQPLCQSATGGRRSKSLLQFGAT
jgi:hypothetical protein